jgi:hypothetical protein
MALAGIIVLMSFSVLEAAPPPHDVAKYIERREGCNHWSGEEGYDAGRRTEIDRNIQILGCVHIDKDERALLHRYRHHPAIVHLIRAAHDALL